MPTLLSRFQGTLLAIEVADALGMPWEGKNSLQIRAETMDKGVAGFCAPTDHHRVPDTRHLEAGKPTDDWRITAATARSIARSSAIDLLDMALAYVHDRETSSFGWGKTTERSIDEIKAYLDTRGAGGRNPLRPLPFGIGATGCGNGVAMRIAPVALYVGTIALSTPEVLRRCVFQNGRMTHSDPRSSWAAYAVADLIATVAGGADVDPRTYLRALVDDIDREEAALVEQYKLPVPHSDRFGTRLRRLLKQGVLEASPQRFIELVGNGFIAIESVVYAIGIAFRHWEDGDIRAAALEAVNGGLDADTNAGIACAVLGAKLGVEGIPEEWRTFRPEYEEAVHLGRELYEAAMQEE